MEPQIAANYGWESGNAEESHAYLIPPVLRAFKQYNTTTLLDIGTGNGATIPIWMSKGIKVTAIEPDPEGYNFSKRHTGADVRQLGVGDKLPDEWNSNFDTVVCLEVIEHLFNPDDLIDTVRYTLKKDGIVIISTPYHGYLKNLALAIAGKWDFHHHPQRVGGHIKFWSKDTLADIFERNGFSQISFEGAGRFPFLWKSMVMIFKKN